MQKYHHQVYELVRQGKSIAEIARICNIKKKSVRNRLRELVNSGVLSKEEYEEIRSRTATGHSASTSTLSLAWEMPTHEPREAPPEDEDKEPKSRKMDIYTATLAVLTRARIPLPIPELARTLDITEREAKDALEYLKTQGFNIAIEDGLVELLRHVQPGQKIKVRLDEYTQGQWKRIGFVTDTHVCSKYAREDALHTIYDIYAREGIRLVLHGGNIVDGYAKKVNHYDLIQGLTGYTAQVEYLLDRYPYRKGIETWFVTGDDHEGWWIKDAGINIGEYIELKARQKGREDLKFIGHIEADLELKAPRGSGWLKVMHPGGGTAYATSYTIQKIVESFQGGEKPHVLLAGHYHKFNVDFSREVYSVQGGCVQDQTPFMRKKKLQAHVGASIVEFHQSSTGEINRFRVEWFSFYDKKFYVNTKRFVSW